MEVVARPSVSFELFPPNTIQGFRALSQTCLALRSFEPEYFSVTFGAGGADRDKTFKAVTMLLANQVEVVPHFSCIGLSKETIRQILKTYMDWGIRRLVAIRGDLPEKGIVGTGDFRYTNEFVEFIRKETGSHFYISVAAYPEFHPQSDNVFSALENFKRKVEAGANVAITQYFFNADAYFYFLESCDKLNIRIPIIPGVMPIFNVEKLVRFSNLCGAEIPAWLYKRLQLYVHDEASLVEFGIEVVSRLCERLIEGGAPGLHFYTLNKAEPTKTIVKNLSLLLVMVDRAKQQEPLFSAVKE